jgi:hypothetical protein
MPSPLGGGVFINSYPYRRKSRAGFGRGNGHWAIILSTVIKQNQMHFTFWDDKTLWWEFLGIALVVGLMIRYFLRKK